MQRKFSLGLILTSPPRAANSWSGAGIKVLARAIYEWQARPSGDELCIVTSNVVLRIFNKGEFKPHTFTCAFLRT